MEKKGDVIQLNVQGPAGGILFLVVDYENKTVSLIQILPDAIPAGFKITVMEVQSYTRAGVI
jgi:hypothetical protein